MKALIEKSNKLNEIFFPVSLVPTQTINGGMECNPECLNTIIGEINGKKRQIATVGDRYNLVSNEELIMPIITYLILKGIKYEVEITIRNNSHFTVKINITDKRYAHKIADGDIIFPQIVIIRSYNGSAKYQISVGFFRLICANGLTVPYNVEGFKNLIVKGKSTEKFNLTIQKMMGVVYALFDNSNEIVKTYKVLNDTFVKDYSNRVIEVMNATGLKPIKKYGKTENTDVLDSVISTIKKEQKELNMPYINDWLIYNAINYHINNDNVMNNEVRIDKDNKVLNYMLK